MTPHPGGRGVHVYVAVVSLCKTLYQFNSGKCPDMTENLSTGEVE